MNPYPSDQAINAASAVMDRYTEAIGKWKDGDRNHKITCAELADIIAQHYGEKEE